MSYSEVFLLFKYIYIGAGIQSLELFFVMIVACMSVCFFWTFSMNLPDPVEALKGTLIPYVPSYGLHTAVGIVGSLILPQNYYVHSAVVLGHEVNRNNPKEVCTICQWYDDVLISHMPQKIRDANKYLFVDAGVALGIACLINFAVISTFAEQFFNEDCAHVRQHT